MTPAEKDRAAVQDALDWFPEKPDEIYVRILGVWYPTQRHLPVPEGADGIQHIGPGISRCTFVRRYHEHP